MQHTGNWYGEQIGLSTIPHFAVTFRGKQNEIDREFHCVSLMKQLMVLYSISFVERNG
jgi:hypothetical protein